MSQKFLSSVTLAGLASGSILKVNSDGLIVEAVAGTDYVSSVSYGDLNSLTDVVVSNPSADQILVYGQPLGGDPGVNIWYNKTPNYLTSYTETDPIYTASSWYTTANNSSNWDTAYNWGNHEGLYANLIHTHSVFTQATSDVVGGEEVVVPGSNGFVPASGFDDGSKFLRGDGTWQVVTTDLTGYATETWVGQQGYLTSYAETDPVFVQSAAYNVRTEDITAWNAAYEWGDHGEAGYLTSFTETDPIYTASSWYTTTNNSTNWNTAYGWGDHGEEGYLTSYENNYISDVKVVDTNLVFTGEGNAYNESVDLSALPFQAQGNYLTSESDTLDTVAARGNISTTKLQIQTAGNTAGGNLLLGQLGQGTSKWSYITSQHFYSTSEPEGFTLIGGFAGNGQNAVVIGGSIYESNPSTEIQFWTHTSDTHGLGGAQIATIKPNGLGIGTTNPSYKLDLLGTTDAVVARLSQGHERVRYNSVDLLGYNDGHLWLIGNNNPSLVISSSWDWDQQVEISYAPGSSGAAGGVLSIGQSRKNSATYTHGRTDFYVNGAVRSNINTYGVGIRREAASNERLAIDIPDGVWGVHLYRDATPIGGLHVNNDVITLQSDTNRNVEIATGTGNANWNGNTIATRTWVQAQGYLTSETDSQELEWNQAEKLLTISNGNTVDLSQMASVSDIEDAGFITAESDTLATVVTRGNSTTGTITIGGLNVINGASSQVSYFGSTATTQYADIALKTNDGQGEIFRAGTGYTYYGGAKALNIWNSNGPISLHPNGIDNVLFLSNAGNVGIGTTSPGYKLETIGNARISGNLSVGTTYNGFAANIGGIVYVIGASVWVNDGYGYANASSTNTGFYPLSSGDLKINTAGTTALFVSSSGNVGIGTTNPSSRLHVYENADVWHARFGSDAGELRIGGQTSSGAVIQAYTPAGVVRDLYIQRDGGNVGIGTNSPQNKLSIGSSQEGGIDFLYDSSNAYKNQIKNYWNSNADSRMDFNIGRTANVAPVTVMSVGYNSNVGIGTTVPTQKLHVAGNGLFEKIGIGSINTTYDLYNNGSSYLNGEVIIDDRLYLSGALGGISQDNIIGRPKLYWGASALSTGAVTIKFPGGFSNYGMVHAVIDIYEYSGNNVCTIIIGGHNWNGRWYAYGANVTGYTDKPVRVAYREGRYEIIIGDNNSSWSYGQVVLRKIQNGNYYASSMNVTDGYEIEQIADVTTDWISEDLRGLKTAGSLTVYGSSNTEGSVYLYGKDAIQGGDSYLRLNNSGNFTSGVYTPAGLRNDGAFENYGGIYGYATIRGRKAQTDGDYTTAALWTESYNNTTTGIAFHISGVVGKFLEMRTNGSLYWDGAPLPTQAWVTSQGYTSTAYVDEQIAALVDAAPEALNTLKELSNALGDDQNFATNVTNSIAGKVSKSGDTMTGNLSVAGNTDLGNSVGSTLSSTHTTKISGYAMRYDASNRYGNYGVLILNSDSGWTGSARKFMLTSGLNTNRFAIIRSVDADTDPAFGDGGVISSGTADFVIDNSGNIGIGTTGPGNKLDVQGNAGVVTINTNGSLYAGGQFISGAGEFASSSSGTDINFRAGATHLMVLKTSGNVGIGTNSPSSPRNSGFTPLLHAYNNSAGVNPAIVVSCEDNQMGGFIAGDNAGSSDIGWGWNAYYQGSGNNFFNIRIGDNGTWTDRFTIDRYGNVGIGTTDPTEKLHVAGRIMAAGSGYTLNPTAPIFGQYSSTRGYVQVPSGGQFEIWTGGTAEIATFYNNQNAAFWGNVGIGTNSPGNRRLVVSQPVTDEWIAGFVNTGDSPYGVYIDTGANPSTAYSFATYTNEGTGFFIRNNGLVGVGTNSPSYNLDVTGTVNSSAYRLSGGFTMSNMGGYAELNNWVHLPGYHGLYSGINGAHIYPNNGSYGSWRIQGSRNNYRGLEFGSGVNGDVSLMIHENSNITGFHNNSYGWQFRWENGTLYCDKNSYGGGTSAVVLDSSNYTSYAATSAQGSNADTAHGWGNHAGLYLSLTGGGNVTGRTDFKELGIKADGSDTLGENGFFRWTNNEADRQMLTQLNAENGLAFWSYGGSSWANVATLSQEGNFTVSGTITEQSSIRYKENIVDLEPVTDKVYALRPVRYNKIGSETQEIGLIAEEVAELFPEVVHYNDEGQPESLNYTRLSVLLLQTVKELSERIQKLENK